MAISGTYFPADPSPGTQCQYNSDGYLASEDFDRGLVLLGVNGFNPGETTVFLLFFANAGGGEIQDGDIPFQSLLLPSGATFSWSPASPGILFPPASKLAYRVSSTGDALTAFDSPVWVFADLRAQGLV